MAFANEILWYTFDEKEKPEFTSSGGTVRYTKSF
jgi:hypothetical protein